MHTAAYTDGLSKKAEERLRSQYGWGAKRYGAVASWGTIAKGIFFDIAGNSIAQTIFKSNHPAQLHYGIWDRSDISTFDQAIRRATDVALMAVFPTGVEGAKRIIHLGSGFGGVDIQVCRAHSQLSSVGISIDPVQIEVAQELADLYGVEKRVTFLKQNFLKLTPFKHLFDGGVSLEATCHVPEPQMPLLWKNIAQCLKSGARFVIHDWYVARKLTDEEGKKLAIFLKGWDLPGCPMVDVVVGAARKSGFVLESNQNLTKEILPSARAIYNRARLFKPLVVACQNTPFTYIQSLGITKPEAIDFAITSLVQRELFETGVIDYRQLVFRKG